MKTFLKFGEVNQELFKSQNIFLPHLIQTIKKQDHFLFSGLLCSVAEDFIKTCKAFTKFFG